MRIKQLITSLLLLLCSFLIQGQVTTTPALIQQDHTGEIVVHFDATQGNKGMVGATSCYAHTGVITNESLNDKDWKHAPQWENKNPKYKMVSTGTDTWKLIIPSIKAYYELNTNEIVKKLAFVFRNEDGSKQGKGIGDTDIFVTLLEPGLQVAFTHPTGNYAIPTGTSLELAFASSFPAELSLQVNGETVKSVSSATSLSHTYKFTTAGDYLIRAVGSLNGKTVTAELTVCVVSDVVSEPRPNGVTDGINYPADPTQATLVLHAPGKLSVFAIGDFSDWSQQNKYQMKRDGDYWWITLTDLEPGREYGFQYLVNTIGAPAVRVGDPYSEKILHELDSYIPASTYPDLKSYPTGLANGPVSILQTAQPPYNWEITDFKVKNKGSLSIYELLIRDFTDTSDLNGVIEKLDYIKNLGVTAIELMPCQEFSGNDSWGYNPIYYFAMDKAYGTKERYKQFIDECHKRGIAVLLDVVYNQADQDMPFVKMYFDGTNPSTDNPWFNVTAPHPYSVFYDFNHESPYTRAFVKRNLKFLLEEYKFDGFRFDLTKGFTNKPSSESSASNYDQSRIDILKDYNRAIREVNPDAVVILEHFCSVPEEKVLAEDGMMLWRNANGSFANLMQGYTGDATGLYANGTSMPVNSLIGFIESHDEERQVVYAKNKGLFTTSLSSRLLRAQLCALYSMLVPGPKMIWQFGEMGYDVSINENGRTGRKPTHWEYLDVTNRKNLVNLYAILLNLRKSYPFLFDGTATFNWSNATALSAESRIEIKHPQMTIIAIANFSQNALSVSPAFPQAGTWHDLIADAPVEIAGSAQNTPLPLAKNTFRLFASQKPDFVLSTETVAERKPLRIYPNPTTNRVYFNEGEMEIVRVISANGIILKTDYRISEISLSEFPGGNYWLSVYREGKWMSIPVLKQ